MLQAAMLQSGGLALKHLLYSLARERQPTLPAHGTVSPFYNALTLTLSHIPVDDDTKTMIISFYVS